MDDENNLNYTVIGVMASVLVVTGIACALIGVQGLMVALVCLCAIECYVLADEGMYDTAALLAMVAVIALFGLDLVTWLGSASLATCIAVIALMIWDIE